MKPGDLVQIHLPMRYHGVPHIDRLDGSLGLVLDIEGPGLPTVLVLVDGARRSFNPSYLLPVYALKEKRA